ncbi:MAG TPA: AAA family ATPase, partial [Fervidobacterium sp.]|nr:AAA family ATPase [Fervidobacterium sp.]
MTIGEIMEKLEIRMERMIRLQPEKKRLYFDKLKSKFDSRAILLYGPRGVGKTTFSLSVARENDMLYISGDDPLLLQHNFAEIGEEILTNYSGIIIDEVHFLKDWSLTVKTLYDSFPNKKLWLSDSSSIILRKGIADLSRRFVTKKLPIMSLREYIYFETGKELPVISSPFEPGSLEEVSNLIREVDIMKYFREYKTHGTRPFYIEGNYPERMKNIIEKSLYYDILHLVGSVSENHIRLMKSLISYLIFSKIPTVNIESMCKEWGVGKPKLYELLNALEEIELINIVRYKG